MWVGVSVRPLDLAQEHPEVGVRGGHDEVAGYYFNGPDTIRKKVQAAKMMGLGGVMIWEVGQDFHPDDERSLLKAIANEVWPDGRPKPPPPVEKKEKKKKNTTNTIPEQPSPGATTKNKNKKEKREFPTPTDRTKKAKKTKTRETHEEL